MHLSIRILQLFTIVVKKEDIKQERNKIADIYISISMETFGHRKYKIWGEDGNE